MRFTPRFLEELRDRVRVTDIVGRKVKLIRRGRNHLGLCPFHSEKSPSFSVNADKGFYHCFGCGAHGDIITFVMETEGLAFPDAVEQLANDAGMALPVREDRDEEREKTRRSLYDVMELAAVFFESELKGARGAKARAYLDGRQLTGPAVAPFRLGFAPDSRNGLKDHLTAKGVTIDDMIEAGLVGAPDDGGAPYDRFRGRVIFPITDVRGRVIAFGGRTLDPDGKPKYLNSPETPLFKKSTVLFNLAAARKAASQGATLIAVEGYVDVIALVLAGFAGAVAPLGTALTEEHLQMMWRIAPEPILCFDGDAAGIKAAQRGIDLTLPLLEPGQSLRFALLPGGQDPDDLIRARGSAAMQAVLDEAVGLADMLWRREIESADLATPERRAGAEKKLMACVQEIADPKVRDYYRTMMQERLRALFAPAPKSWAPSGQGRREGWGQGSFSPKPGFKPDRPGARPAWTPPVSDAVRRSAAGRGLARTLNPSGMAEEALVMAALTHPFLLDAFPEVFATLPIAEPQLDKLRRELLHAVSLEQSLDSQGLRDHVTRLGYGDLCERLERRPMLKSMAMTRRETSETVVLREFNHAVARHHKLTSLETEHAQAAEALKRDATEENLARLRAIAHELQSVIGSEAGPPDAF
ncbi:MAG: DNA primase [Alphaproteobacteria bacterium]|nr:DNA primase [Alphaproteobacteria bacterium]